MNELLIDSLTSGLFLLFVIAFMYWLTRRAGPNEIAAIRAGKEMERQDVIKGVELRLALLQLEVTASAMPGFDSERWYRATGAIRDDLKALGFLPRNA